MGWQTNIYALLPLVAAILSSALALYTWPRRKVPGAVALMALALCVAEWSLAYTLELATSNLASKIWWAKLQYAGIGGAPLSWLIFTMQYISKEHLITRRRIGMLLIIPVCTFALVLTNEAHHLIWRSVSVVAGDLVPALHVEYGPWFWVHAAFCYGLLLVGSGFLVQILIYSRNLYRWQAAVMLLSALLPWLGNILYVLRIDPLYPLDPAPFTFALSALLLAWCLFRFRLLDIVPVAHGLIIEGMRDGIIVLDVLQRVVNLNRTAERIIGQGERVPLGQSISEMLVDQEDLVALCQKTNESRSEIILDQAQSRHTYDVRVSPLLDRHGRLTGRLLTLRDVTERKRAEEAQRFLAEASTLLAASLDYETTLANIARLAVPHLADGCTIHMLDADQSIRQVAATFDDPVKQAVADELEQHYPMGLATPYSYPKVLRTGQAELLDNITDERLEAVANDARHLALLRGLGLRSAISVPLIAHKEALGTITFLACSSKHRYTLAALAVAEDLGRRAALAVENAQLYRSAQRRLAEVTTVQRVASVINSTAHLDAVFQTVVSQISAAFGYQLVSIYLCTDDVLELQAYVGYNDVVWHIPFDQGVSGRVVRSGKAAFVRNAAEDSDFILVYPGTYQAIIMPLKTAEGDVLGTLAVESNGTPELTDDDFALLQLLADQVSVAVANARLFAERKRAEKAAEAATRAKSLFLANMSHEIRTPLSGVIGMTHMLLDTHLDSQQQEYVKIISTNGKALLSVINDILDFSKIESGKLDLAHVPFDLRQCVEEAFDIVAPKAMEKQLALSYVVDPCVPGLIMGDIARLRQILVNLLSNAIKFTDTGEVALTVSAESSIPIDQSPAFSLQPSAFCLTFSVRDTGIGIPHDRRDQLFQSFSQLDMESTRRHGGTGLGLAISKRLTELLGGRIWLESELGRGSTFSFTITTERAPDQPQITWDNPIPQFTGKRVLLLGEVDHSQRMLATQVRTWGVVLEDTDSLAGAHDLIQRDERFDLIVIDPAIVAASEAQIVAELRKGHGHEQVPIVLLTTLGHREAARAEVGDRVQAYLSKPVKLSQLHSTLTRLFDPDAASALLADAQEQTNDWRRSLVPLRILVADDDSANQMFALHLLSKLGYTADVVNDGKAALEQIEQYSYDVVLLDVQMPELDGFQVARAVCERWMRNERPYLIAVTASAMESDREECLVAGMDDYLSKPLDFDELCTALERASKHVVVISHANRIEYLSAPQAPNSDADSNGYTVIDAVSLNKLRQSFGANAPQLLSHLITLYLNDATQLVQTLHTAVEQNDAVLVAKITHRLKASSALIAAKGLSQRCEALEQSALVGASANWQQEVQALGEEFEHVRIALEAVREREQ